jgi:hypothetical protein
MEHGTRISHDRVNGTCWHTVSLARSNEQIYVDHVCLRFTELDANHKLLNGLILKSYKYNCTVATAKLISTIPSGVKNT